MTLSCLLRVPVTLGLTAALVAATYPDGLSAAVRDFRDYAEINSAMTESSEREAEMTLRSAELVDRITAKEAIVKEVVAGRLSLTEATRQFLTLNGDDPVPLRFIQTRYDGSTLEEKVARNVIEHVSAALRWGTGASASASGEVIADLDRQFRARYGHPR